MVYQQSPDSWFHWNPFWKKIHRWYSASWLRTVQRCPFHQLASSVLWMLTEFKDTGHLVLVIVKDQSSHLVYLYMHKITNLWKFYFNWSSKLPDNNERSCVHSDAWFQDFKLWYWGLKIKFVENYLFLKNSVTSEGVVSHNVLFYQQLVINRYRVRFYANNNNFTNSVQCL